MTGDDETSREEPGTNEKCDASKDDGEARSDSESIAKESPDGSVSDSSGENREEDEMAGSEEKEDDANPLFRFHGGIWWRYFAWALAVLLLLAAFIWLLVAVQTVSIPFLMAFILAYLFNPVVDRLEERGMSRTLGICVLLVVLLALGAVVVLLIGPQLVRELGQVPGRLHQLALDAVPWVEERFGVLLPRTLEGALEGAQRWLGSFDVEAITAPTLDVLRAVMGGTASVISIVLALLFIPVFTFFLLRDFDRIVDGARALLPRRYRSSVVARFQEIDKAMSGFIRGQLTVAGILAVLYSVGLWAVGLPMALVVGTVSGLGNMVPYLGTALGLVFATLMALLDWQGMGHLLLVYAIFAAVQMLESWLLTPRIVGDSVGLSPFLVIIAVLVFGELLGFVGILIAVPLAAIIKILLRVLVEEYRASPFFRA